MTNAGGHQISHVFAHVFLCYLTWRAKLTFPALEWQVNENQDARFLSGRAEIIDELESSIPSCLRARNAQSWYPRYVHFLRVSQEYCSDNKIRTRFQMLASYHIIRMILPCKNMGRIQAPHLRQYSERTCLFSRLKSAAVYCSTGRLSSCSTVTL